MPKLHVVIASTRPGRKGPAVADWVHELATRHSGFDVELVDLSEFNLPVYDEPQHPMLGNYQHEHTKRWSAKVSEADAFVFVTPEYDFGTAPSLQNALVFLYNEWNYKAVAFVSYGGISGGLRAVQMTKQTVAALKMVPLVEAVSLPFFGTQIEDGVFKASENQEVAGMKMLDELARWTAALGQLRTS